MDTASTGNDIPKPEMDSKTVQEKEKFGIEGQFPSHLESWNRIHCFQTAVLHMFTQPQVFTFPPHMLVHFIALWMTMRITMISLPASLFGFLLAIYWPEAPCCSGSKNNILTRLNRLRAFCSVSLLMNEGLQGVA